jgi:glycosyltransferase involved in cell wall biosynthesis
VKILVIHQHFLFPGQPGGSRFNAFASFWAQAGHEVEVIAGDLNYATGEKAKDVHGWLVDRRREEGIRVWRCRVPSSYTRSWAGRMWSFFGFTVSAVVAALRSGRADVIVATSPPLVTAIPGWIASRFHWRRVPWIFEVRDLWPESAITTGVIQQRSMLARMLYALERWACRRSDRVNVLTPAFRDDLVKRGLAPVEKIAFIPNAADLDRFAPGEEPLLRESLGWKDKVVALYAGAHGRANALHQLVHAAELLKQRDDILIACVGDGPERHALEADVRERGLTNIVFLGPRPKDEMPAYVRACDIGVAVLQDNPTFRTVYPNKVFDYMACARPSLLAIDGIARELVCEEAEAGLFAHPENAEAIASAVEKLADDLFLRQQLGENGRRWVEHHACREMLAETYLDLMAELVS